MENNSRFILEVKDITKYYGGVCALNKVDLELVNGEILGIVGDNGAGKSTLVKIISGVVQKDDGEIFFEGKKVKINSPTDAKKLGIETVYQNLGLVDTLSVPSNIFLNREIIFNVPIIKYFGILNKRKMYKESQELLKKLGINVDMNRAVTCYSGGQRQSFALGKIVYWGKKVAILDEPTASLGVKESNMAVELIKYLSKEHGLSVIIISHNLQHIFKVVDRIMVLRRGERVGLVGVHEVTAEDVVSIITGGEVVDRV